MMSELTARNSSIDEIAAALEDHPEPVVAIFARRYLGNDLGNSELEQLRDANGELEVDLEAAEDMASNLRLLLEEIREEVDLPADLLKRVDAVL